MSGLRISLLGPPHFELHGSLTAVQERKAIVLLVYLAVSSARHSRDALATMLWPKQSQSAARASLRHALWSLRKAGLGEIIDVEREKLGIHPPYWLDVIEFNQLLNKHRQHGHAPGASCSQCLSFLMDAISLYKDDFLAGFTLRDSPQFDEWQYFQREHCKQLLAYALECLARWHVHVAEWEPAIEHARRWVALDSLHEPAQRWLMLAYAGNNQRNLALRQYEALKRILDEELGTTPEKETVDLAEAIYAGKLVLNVQELPALDKEPQNQSQLDGEPGQAGEALQQMRLQPITDGSLQIRSLSMKSQTSFLEREPFIEKLTKLLLRARAGEGRMVFLGAEAGGGKTTLIQHFCAGAQETTHVSIGICDPLSTPQPMGPLWDIAAEMGGDFAYLIRAGEKPERIFRAFLENLRREQTFHLVIFEDVHWGDEATLDLLRFIGRRIESTYALVIASFRDDEIEGQHPLRILLGDLATASGIERLHLPPLSRQAVGVLVAGSELDPDMVYTRTGGNPFLVAEMLASGVDRIPDSARDAVLVRAARLTQPARSVLDLAAVIGPRVETSLLVEMTGAEVDAIEECLSVGMLRARGGELEFRHELAWQTVLEAISPPRSLLLHRRALEVLRGSLMGSGDLARLAHHAESAADSQAVLEYAPAAARQAAAAGAHRQSAAQYERALRFSSRLPGKERGQLLQAYARECHLNDWNAAALQALEEAGQFWKESGDHLKEGDNLCRQTMCLIPLGKYVEANQVILLAIEILSALPPSSELAYAYSQYARILTYNSEYSAAISMAQKAIDLGERFKDSDHTLIRAHNTIGISLIYTAEAGGQAQLEQSIVLAEEVQDHAGVALGYANLSRWTGIMYGWDIANQYIAKGLAYCAEFELDFHNYFLLASQASAHLYQGHWSEAEETAKFILSQQNLSADTRFWASLVLGRVRTLRGDPENSSMLNEALALAKQFGTLMFLAPALATLAEAAWLAGEPNRSLVEVRSVYNLAVMKQHIWFTGELAFWLWRAGEEIDLPDWAMPVFASQIRGDWAAAAAEWQRRRCPYEHAWALAVGDAEARLTSLQIFEQLGAAPAIAKLKRGT